MKHKTAVVFLGEAWSWLCSCGEYGEEHASKSRAEEHAERHARTGVAS
jgi:hypothetical protein